MLGVTTDTLLNDNGYEQHVVDIKDKEFLQNMKRVDSMSEEDRAFVKKMLELMDSEGVRQKSAAKVRLQEKTAEKIKAQLQKSRWALLFQMLVNGMQSQTQWFRARLPE